MKWPTFADPQFLDALGPGGFNQAFNTVSGSIASVGSGVWAYPGLLAPEAMTVGFAGLVATTVLNPPFGVVSSGGVVVRAHGTVSNQDTQTYLVNFGSLVPATGSVTAYLTAQIQQILQNPVSLPGPPPGFPSYNPTFVPTVSYATSLMTLAIAGSTTLPDNINSFELARFTLNAGQSTAPAPGYGNQVRATPYSAQPPYQPSVGGVLSVQQLQQTLSPAVSGVTLTLPTAQLANGVTARFVNNTAGAYTIAATTGNTITGISGSAVASVVVPSAGAVELFANGPTGTWDVIAINASMNITWSGTNTFQQAVFFGTSGQFYINPNQNGNEVLNFAANNFIEYVPGSGLVINSTGIVAVDGVATFSSNVTVTGNTTTDGFTYFGTTNQCYINPNAGGGNLIFNFQPNNFLEFVAGTGFQLTTGGSFAVTAPGGVTTSAALSAGGTIASNGNITANNGRLRASLGATGSGDPDAATILADFPSSLQNPGYQKLPNGLTLQWGNGGVVCNNLQSEGGLSWYYGSATINFPTPFTSTVLTAVATPIDIVGHLAINANVVELSGSAMQIVGHCTAVQNLFFNWFVIGL